MLKTNRNNTTESIRHCPDGRIYSTLEFALTSPSIAKSVSNFSNYALAYKELSAEMICQCKHPKKLRIKRNTRKKI